MAKKNGAGAYLLAGALFLGGVGYLAWSGLSEGGVYFLNVAEAHAATPDKLKAARLFGTVASEGIVRPQDSAGVDFRLEDKDNPALTMNVSYRGVVPDTFKPGAEVIVEGGMNAEGAMFSAKTLMTKCPSKYQKENRKDG